MKVSFSGWERDHGEKVMLQARLTEVEVVHDWSEIRKDELKLKRYHSSMPKRDGVKVSFHTDMRLGGSQLVNISFSRAELLHMLAACSDDLTIGDFAKTFAAKTA